MSLTGLLTAALRDAGLARARELARAGFPDADGLDLTGAARHAPVRGGGGRRPGRAGPAGRCSPSPPPPARPTTSPRRCAACCRRTRSPSYPAWETLPHERLSPRSDTVGRRLAVLRRLAHPEGNPVRVVVAPVRSLLQPQLKRLGDLEPVELRTGGGGRPRRRRPPAVRHGVRPGRSGHQARRVRRPRRHPRRVPADRRAPLPGRVLGRRGRGDPHLRGRRPAHDRQGRHDARAAVPRAAADPGGARARPARSSERHPELLEILDKLAEGIPVEGMESLAPALVGPDSLELLVNCMPPGTHVLLCDPERIRTRAHDLVRTSPTSSSRPAGPRPRSAGRRRSTSAPRRSRPWPTYGRPPPTLACRGGRCRRSGWSRPPPRPRREDVGGRRRGGDRDPRRGRRDRARRPAHAALPRRDRPGRRRPQALVRRRLVGRAGLRGARPGAARGRGAARRRPGRDPDRGASRRRRRPGELLVTCGGLNHGFVDEASRLVVLTGNDVTGGRGRVDPRHAQDAQPAAQHDRPAGAAGRRLRRARAARHRPVRRAGAAHRQRRRPGIPRDRVRGDQARPARRPAVRADRPARPAVPLRRRRDADAAQDGRLRVAEGEGAGPQGRPRDRRAAHPAVRRPQGVQGPRVRAGHARGSASWRTRSRGPRRPTSSPRSTRSSATWSSRSRWTG